MSMKSRVTHDTKSSKTDFYLPFRASWSRYPDAFTNLDERQHTERRRIVNSLYSMSNILHMEKSVDECIQMLLRKLGECASKGSVVDMSVWIQW
jgi:cytochrome P450